MRASEQDRDDVQTLRADWPRMLESVPVGNLVFLDESSASTSLAKLYGRCVKGYRLRDSAPVGHWLTVTMLSAVRIDGPIAPLLVDGAVDGEIFTAWIEQFLLRELRPGDVVIMDNLSAHRIARVSQLLQSAGHSLLYLPPYSPDLNPIEQMWSKVKNILRTLKARTFDELTEAVRIAISKITAQNCRGYFEHCGYGSIFI